MEFPTNGNCSLVFRACGRANCLTISLFILFKPTIDMSSSCGRLLVTQTEGMGDGVGRENLRCLLKCLHTRFMSVLLVLRGNPALRHQWGLTFSEWNPFSVNFYKLTCSHVSKWRRDGSPTLIIFFAHSF